MRNKKISLITNIYTPYRHTQFQKIKDQYSNFNVFFTGDKRENRHWEQNDKEYYFWLKKLFAFKRFGMLNKGLIEIVKNSDVVIIGGYEQPSYILLSLLSKIYKKPSILLFDGIAPSKISDCKKNWKFFIKFFVIRNFSAYWINGKISRKYFTKCFEVNVNKIFNQYLTIDRTKYEKMINQKTSIKKEIREVLTIPPSDKVILYSGRFIGRKRVSDIIKALGKLQSEGKYQNMSLLLIGDVDVERISNYKSLCEKYNVRAVFGGFIEQTELYKYYFASDLLILPSEDEPWGLVVNEAVYSEIPILVSNDCGVSLDLVVDQQNGYTFECGNIDDLVSKIIKTMELDKKQVSEISRRLSESWNLDNSVTELNKALKYVFENNNKVARS